MTSAQPLQEADIIDKFRGAMASMGLRTSDTIVADGDINRFHIDGDPKNTKNGWLVLHIDGIAAGAFGCWKRGIDATWCSKSEAELTSAERNEMQQRIERAKRERDERQRAMQAAVAQEAQRMWDAAAECDTHPYLTRKGVKSHGLRIGQWMNGNPALLVPISDTSGHIVSLQAIFGNVNPAIGRDKDFLAGGKKRACWFSIGMPPPGGNGNVVLCEGYATGASIYEATGYFTVCAFDAGNLKAVAYELRRRWPGATIIMAADNDRWTVPTEENPHIIENPGVTFARQAQEKIPARVFVAVPEFADLEGKPTDFNDLHQREGAAKVVEQINAALPVEAKPANDNEPNAALPLEANVSPFGFPHMSDKGQPLNTVENLAYLLREYGIGVRYNGTRKLVEVRIPGRDYGDDLNANCTLAEINSLCSRNRMPKTDAQDYIKLISSWDRYSPVEEFIKSNHWDGKTRLPELFATLTTPAGYDRSILEMLVRRWLISAAAAALTPRGFWSKGVLVLQGGQSEGKTSWFKSLLPDSMRNLLKVGATIDPANKDSVSSVISHWIVELGELDATFRKADIARLKSFISQDIDQLRRPYDRLESEYQRRTVFFASVNPKVFLVDDTGNVRWWTIPVNAVNHEHSIDVQQLWAEAAHYYEAGERWWLTKEEEARLEGTNVDHQAPNTIEELILAKFDWSSPSRSVALSATEVLIAIGYDRPTNPQAKDAGAVLRRLTGGDPKKSNGRLVFMMPKKLTGDAALRDDEDDDRPF